MPAAGISAKRSRASGSSDGGLRNTKQKRRPGQRVVTKEESQLVASLFNESIAPTATERHEIDLSDDEGADDGDFVYDTRGRGGAEQHLHDDELFVVDNGAQSASDHESELSRDDDSEEEKFRLTAASSSDEDLEDKQEGTSRAPGQTQAVNGNQARRRKAVWHDPSLATLMIPLAGKEVGSNGNFAGTQKLRRLREGADEKEISGVEYERRLRQMYERLHPRPAWASLDQKKPDDGEAKQKSNVMAGLLSRDTGLVKGTEQSNKRFKTRRALQPGTLDVQRLRDGNEAQGRNNVSQIEALEFHPSARAHVMLTASKDRRLRLFQINGTTNPHLETIHFSDLPLKTAHFDPTGSSVVVSGPRPFFYAHDLESGKTTKSSPWRAFGSNDEATQERDLSNLSFAPDESVLGQRRRLAVGGRRGAVYLLDWGQTGGSGGASLMGTLRMNAPLAGMAWDPLREHRLVTMSTQGIIHSWDVRNMACTLQRSDAGLFAPMNLAASPAGGDFWAAGSDTGIVNIYNRSAVEGKTSMKKQGTSAVLPIDALKSVDNIVTASTTLRFNPSGEILAIASDKKRDALKLLHLPSLRIFDNWPTSGTPLGRITATDFSRRSEYLALGNHRGKVLLYSLPQYQQSS